MQKLTIPTSAIQVNDTVVGFNAQVAAKVVNGYQITIMFTDGQTWKTSDHFTTTVLR